MEVIAILIPVLARPHRVAGLVENIHTYTSSEHRIVFICSSGDDDEIAAVRETDEDLIVSDFRDRGQYAAKINTGYMMTREPWLFTGADDLVFHPDWDAHALLVAKRTGAGVIGTQDTQNAMVKRGLQSTHSLVSRAYIEEYGGTFDGTGAVYSEVYDHQFVDMELVETAKLRRQWAFSKRSVVEHRHPHWKTAEDDDTYRKAMRQTTRDRRLYVQRMRRFERVEARRPKRAAL